MEGLYSRMSRLVAASLMVVVLGSLLFSVSLGSEGSAFAAEPAGRVEVPELRTESSKTYRNADGTFATVLSFGWLGSKLGLKSGDEAITAAKAGTSVVRYDADFALGQLTRGGSAKASELVEFGMAHGWTRVQTATGPIKFVDANGVTRVTIKGGSPRAPGSNFPHVEIRNAAGQRIDPYGNTVTRRSPGNHTPIEWDLP